jgi:hypothetical protein
MMEDTIKDAVVEYITSLLSDVSAQKAFFEDYWPEDVEYNEEMRGNGRKASWNSFSSTHY